MILICICFRFTLRDTTLIYLIWLKCQTMFSFSEFSFVYLQEKDNGLRNGKRSGGEAQLWNVTWLPELVASFPQSGLLYYFLTEAKAGSQGRHLLITMGWQPPVIPAVQATQWNSAPQYCPVQHYKHLSHGRRSKNVLFSWTRGGTAEKAAMLVFCLCCVKPLHHQCFGLILGYHACKLVKAEHVHKEN